MGDTAALRQSRNPALEAAQPLCAADEGHCVKLTGVCYPAVDQPQRRVAPEEMQTAQGVCARAAEGLSLDLSSTTSQLS